MAGWNAELPTVHDAVFAHDLFLRHCFYYFMCLYCCTTHITALVDGKTLPQRSCGQNRKERLKRELNSDLVAVYDISEGGYLN